MIEKAVVQFYVNIMQKSIVIPCHRHADAYEIMYEFGLMRDRDYKMLVEGFLDDHDNFLTRQEAYIEAENCNQLKNNETSRLLYSEDLW